MRKILLLTIVHLSMFVKTNAQLVSEKPGVFAITEAAILVDKNDFALVKKAAELLQQDIEMVTGKKIPVTNDPGYKSKHLVLIGTATNSAFIKSLIGQQKINPFPAGEQWEHYSIKCIKNAFNASNTTGKILVIAGSDRRGAAFGVFELSKQLGVSPWYWWADVPVKKQPSIFINTAAAIQDAPKVKYRGIFINDEAPALSNWSKATFGGFNHQFYEKVFELMLRLKANYLWPAMWGNAFYDDDSLNIQSADTYGIVIGTSHHEPLMRAHDEWKRYGKGKWNYDSNANQLQDFWTKGMQRATNEKIVSVGMRGDGDEPMSNETATALLEKIVEEQRKIITAVTGMPASETPQLWALYKEVQDYYEKGMRVPDDVTLLLCDDNWGNIRQLPKPTAAKRKGGYGIYYHFDYVGGPRNYKWINTNPIPRVWEQMHLAYEYDVKQIWIVNVGDIKPLEFPISFFLDYAWNPEKIGAADLQQYTISWAEQQFGKQHATEIADIISKYSKYNGRRKPELLDAKTYRLEDSEWYGVVTDYNELLEKAKSIQKLLPQSLQDAYFQLVLHPVKASANLNDLYYHVALNHQAYANQWKAANDYASTAKALYINDSLITNEYHQLNNGKWNHMMSQTHIGYTSWQQPKSQQVPLLKYLPEDSIKIDVAVDFTAPRSARYMISKDHGKHVFYEKNGYVSIEADHFTTAINGKRIQWNVLPDHGRAGSAVTSFPVTAAGQKPGAGSPHIQYEFYTYSKGDFSINAYFSPTLNFHNTGAGLQFAISVDDEAPQTISINSNNKTTEGGINYRWVADNIIIKNSKHHIKKPGKHILKYWMVNSGVVLQKLVLDFGGLKASYLGPPETINTKNKTN